jgi:lipopolysaccharide export LptBFGC system permease protein LptF
MATVFVFQRFIESNQLTALKATGESPLILLKPLLLIVSMVMGYLYISNAYISPNAWRNFRDAEFKIKNNINPPKNAGTLFSSNGFSIYAQHYQGNLFFGNIFIIDSRNPEKVCSYFASIGTIKNNILMLKDGERIEIDRNIARNSITKFKSYKYNLTEIIDASRKKGQPNEKFMHELWRGDPGSKQNDEGLKSLFHQKIAAPLLTLVFALLAFFIVIFAPYGKKFSPLRTLALLAGIIILQGLFFWFANASCKNIAFAHINYAVIAVITGVLSLSIFIKQHRL